MKRFASAVGLVLLTLFSGCASSSSWQAPNVPLPRSTPFDRNEFARNAYLDGFREGYLSGIYPEQANLALVSGPYAEVKRLGFQAGASRARAEKMGAR